MENLPPILRADFSPEQIFGDLLEFELHVKSEHIPRNPLSVEGRTWRQNHRRLCYCCEFKGIPYTEFEDEGGYHFIAKKPEAKEDIVEAEVVVEKLPDPREEDV